MTCGGSHLGFPIGIKKQKFVEDLTMIIPGQQDDYHCRTCFYIGPIGSFYNQVNDTGSLRASGSN
jgi:hypothetical protein